VKRFLRENSLTLAFGIILLLALAGQSWAGQAEFNGQQVSQGQDAISYLQYVRSSDFAVDVAENWQSEFLAVASMLAFGIYLRQRGSPESKPVGSPYGATGAEG
jgi:hypothetical protein